MTAERKPEQRCGKCGEERTARGGDLHCYDDCDWFGHGEPDGCHPFAPLPTESETEREEIRNSRIANEWESRPSERNDVASLEREFAARLSPAPSETPSPEVGIDTDLELRHEWWLNHGCSLIALYGDDGEMQCNNGRPIHPPLDFRRDSLAELKRWVNAGRMARGERALAAAKEQSK